MAEEQLGVHLVGAEVKRWHWVFRDQPVEDYGVDCEAEAPGTHYPTGRRVGIQVKTGKAKYFRSRAGDAGWWYSPGARQGGGPDQHLRYWLESDRPIVIVLVDETTMPESMYWVHVTLDRVQFTGASWKILVPAGQRLDNAAQTAFLEIIASSRASEATDVLAAAVGYLPPQSGRVLYEMRENNHFKALQLAVRLGRGRIDPAVTCDTLLGRDRRYLQGADGGLLAALGGYASAHRCHGQAARAYCDAAALGTAQAPRFLALAAWSLIAAGDRAQARALTDQARAAGARAVLCDWLHTMAVYDGPGLAPVSRTLVLATRADLDGDPLYRHFLAHTAAADGDFAAAVRWHEQALIREPDNGDLMLALACGLLVRESTNSTPIPGADLARALALATAARDQRRQWAGPSEEALTEMLHAMLMASDFPAAVHAAMPAPHGQATEREAASPTIAFLGVKASLALLETEAAALIASRLPPGSPHARAIALMLDEQACPAADDQWLQIVADAGDDTDLAVYALHRAAATGRWPIEQIERQRAAGQITTEGYETLKARSQAARGELDTACRTMRPYEPLSAIAAESLVEILDDAGRLERALIHCDKALTRFATVPLAIKQWHLLNRLGRTSEAVARSVALLARPGLAPMLRATLRTFLVGEAQERRDWPKVEEHSRAALHEGFHQPPFPWTYIGAAYNRRNWTEAWERLVELAPPITSPPEARVWLALHTNYGFTEQDILTALDQIDRFPDDHDLHGRIIATLVTRGNKLAADGSPILPPHVPTAQARLQSAVDAFLANGPTGLRVIASGSLRATFQQIADHLAERVPLDAYLHECMLAGQMPLAAACWYTGAPYAIALLQRTYGPISAVAQEATEFAEDLQDASASLDGRALMDASALAVACELPERFPTLRAAFNDLAIDEQTHFDCLTACSEVRQVPDGISALAIAHDGQILTPVNLSDQDVAAHTARANTLEKLLTTLDTFKTPTDQVPTGDADRPWLRTAYLALNRQSALWCDDVALRRQARAAGCRTFGTVALLHALAEAHHDDTQLREDVIHLAGAQVADILLEPVELAALADPRTGFPGPAGAILARPGYWIDSTPDAVATTLLDVLNEVRPPSPQASAAWVAATCEGQAAYLPTDDLEPTLRHIAEAVARRPGAHLHELNLLLGAVEHVAAAQAARRAAVHTHIAGRHTPDTAPPAAADST